MRKDLIWLRCGYNATLGGAIVPQMGRLAGGFRFGREGGGNLGSTGQAKTQCHLVFATVGFRRKWRGGPPGPAGGARLSGLCRGRVVGKTKWHCALACPASQQRPARGL